MNKETTKTRVVKKPSPGAAEVPAVRTLSEQIFPEPELKLSTLAQILISQQSNQRRATAHTKHRGEVAGTTKKPWKQKGTGRARVGTRRNPVWRGGGIVFGPTNQRNFSKKINQQLIVPALMAVLGSKARRGEVVEISELPEGLLLKTQAWLAMLGGTLDPQSNLLVMAENYPDVRRAIRNLSYIKLITAKDLNALAAATARKIIFLPGALAVLQGRG